MINRAKLVGALVGVLTVTSCSADAPPSSSAAPDSPGASSAGPTQHAEPYAIGGELTAGTYDSEVFATPLRFTVPVGWKVFEDEPGQFGLARLVNDGPCVCVWRDVRAASPNFPEEEPAEGVGPTARDIVEALGERAGLETSEATSVQVGGLDGYVIDLHLAAGTNGAPTLIGTEISRGVYWGVAPGSEQRVWILDLPDGGNIAINAEVCCGADWDEQLDAVGDVVASFEFGP